MFYKGKHDREKQLRFSIRKVSFGAASVAIATFMMFIGGGTVQADAIQSNDSSAASVSSNHQQKEYDKKTDNEDRVNTSNLKVSEATSENTESKDVISSTESFNNESRQEEKQFIKADTSKLELAVARVQALLEKTEVNEKTEEVIKSANEELAKAQDLLSNDKVIQGDIDKELSSLNNIDFILKSIPKASIEKKLEKENKNQDPRNGKTIPGKGESGFREAVLNSANTISKAIEGPTNNNKLGYGNNPQNGVFESAKEQFGDINFDDAVVSEKEVKKQWSRSTASTGGETKILGRITYKWKEKEITKADADTKNALNGWKIESGEKVTAIKPVDPTNFDTNRPSEFPPKPSKIYDLNGKIPRDNNEQPSEGHPLGVNAANQNYANGVNYSGVVGTHNLPKGYYLELGKKGTKIAKEFNVNGNSRLLLSAITGGAYGVMGTAGTGEKIRITVYDADTNKKISTIEDDNHAGMEESHISVPTGNGGNGDGWTEYRAIYETPKETKRIKVEIEALDDGTAIHNSFLKGDSNRNISVTDGYFVGAVNLTVGTGTEMTTNVKTNNKEGGYGDKKLYKSDQKGELEFTVNSVGGIRLYGHAETEIEVPKGVELDTEITAPKSDWIWFGNVPIHKNNISYDPVGRKLRIKYQTSQKNNGIGPYIGIGSNSNKNDGVRSFRVKFTTSPDYKGTATFKVRTFLPNGLQDAEENKVLNTADVTNENGKYRNTVSGVRNSENPNYYYNKTIYIDSTKPKAPTVETIHIDGVQGNSTNKNQERNLLISIPEEETGLTDPEREKKDVIENDKNNNNKDNQHKLAEAEATTEVEKINHAIGGVTSITVTLPNGAKTIKLTKKGDEWYKDSEKLKKVDGKLVLPLPEDINLDEANNALSPDKRIKVTVQDKAGNDSDVAYANVLNEAPTLNVNKDVIYVPKTDVSNKVNTEKLLKQVSDTIVDGKPGIEVADLEDDRDNKETTKPNVSVIDDQGLDTSKPGVYTVTLKATDSEGKDSVEKNDDTDKFDVVVVEGIPQIVSVSDNNIQPDVLKNIDKSQFPDDATFEYKEEVNTSEAGDKNVTVVVKDKAGNKLVEVPATVRVVESYPQYVPVNKEGISPKDSIDPSKFPEGTTFEYKEKPNTGSTGDKDVTVVAKLGTEIVAEIPAKIVVVDSKTQYVAENKENTQPDASKSVDEENYPEGSKFKFKEPVETSKAGDKETTVVVTDKDGNPLVEVPATVVVAKGYSQIVPVSEGNEQPSVKDSIDPDQYPEGSTFEYKEEVNTSEAGDKNVTVVVKDKAGNKLVEVPATVRVVESYPQYVPVNKEGISPKDSIDPSKFPEGTTFEYKEKPNTGSTGDKDVTVVAKLGTEIVAEIPAKIVVVDSKTQYVPVDKSNKQPDASKSIDPEQYPDGVTFKYKTPVDTTTPGEKDVIVEAKDGEDKLVEVPAKVKVVEGKEQLIPVNPTEKPQARDSITPSDYPEGSTFEYKVPDGQTEPFDATTVGDKLVTVVVKDKNGNVLVEVPATIKVVEAKPKPIETPVTNTPLTKDDIAKYVKVPEGGKVTNVENVPDLITPGKKTPVKVTVTLPNGKTTTVEVPVNVTPVKGIETPVTKTPLIPDDYTKGITIPEGGKVTNVENIPDLTTPGKKDPVKVTVELPNGKTITVDVPVNVTPVKGIETPVTNTPLTPEDYTKGITIPEGGKVTNVENVPDLTTPGKKTPVKVTVELPNGKTITVDVPVNVTPVKGIETPVTNTPLTPENYTKGITIPEGGKVTNVENVPDLTTPGKKDPVKVTVELPNGKVITVDVPVNVTPVKEIETPVTTGKLTPEDILKQIKVPEGATTKVENIPDLTTPGKKDPVKVTVTLPNGKVVTVDVPVTVTPVKEIETPVTTTPLTPDDYTKGITIPEGGKVTKVENIPDLTTPGKKNPVKVTIELPNGKVVTVEVPVTVTPVKEIETPVTKDKLTPEDILKQIKVPEGATVKVGDLPDLTTSGKKDPVKVTIELPNGKVVTVEVPVTVTPVKEIETPVTKDKLTPEDILKQIKVPEGATVKVGDLPDLTTPGKKDPVRVTIELPNGKVVTVEIPVTVTPIEDIVKKQGDPITTEDVENHIPKGAKVISIGDKPTTDVPGERPSIPVVIELPNGIRVTVNIPVVVTPKVTPVVVPVGTPVTPEDVQKHIELPNGWKVTKVGEIPTTTTPGTKPVVPVEIELPDGRKITVDVPVIVTPTVRQIVVPQGTPITPDDVKGHIDLPKEPGWEIVEVGEIPTTIPAGVKPSVKVKIKVPTGEIVEVEVPIIVTPKVTPIVVEVGTPITKEDVIKKVGLPEGWEIVEVGEIPTTSTPGTKPVVKVKVKLPDGRIITVEVPVTVTPKSNHGNSQGNNGSLTIHIVTRYQDGDGKEISPEENGSHEPKTVEGYEYISTKTDKNGNVIHTYKKVATPTRSEQPVSPVRPTDPEKPVATPVQTSSTDSKPVAVETTVANDKKELPNTGTEHKAGLVSLGLLGMLSAFGLVARKKKED